MAQSELTVRMDDFEVGEPEPPWFEYSAEMEAGDPFFDRATQAELHRRAADMDTGRNCRVRELIED
jgi:hypothetical protein